MILALVDLLGTYYQAGDLVQVETIARSMLAAIPDDIVSLQFLGLALYQTGRLGDAYFAFKQAAARLREPEPARHVTTCESAAEIAYHAATSTGTGLADGWWQIADILDKFGFRRAAERARGAAAAAQGRSAPVAQKKEPGLAAGFPVST